MTLAAGAVAVGLLAWLTVAAVTGFGEVLAALLSLAG